MRLRLLLLVGTLAATGCASTPEIRSDHDPSFDFTSLRTYSWVYSQPPSGMNPLVYQRVHDSIDRSLAARGFTQASPGDFAVAFTLGRRDRVQVTDFGPYGPFYPGWGVGFRRGWAWQYNQVDIRNVTDGSLAIDIFDVASRRPIWHGTATQEIRPGSVDQQLIDTAVDGVLARFPPQPAG